MRCDTSRVFGTRQQRHRLSGGEQRGFRTPGRSVLTQEDAMTTPTLTETDVRLRDAVMRELDWDPEVDASAIGVAARDGIVTLTGYVDNYAGKLAAERTARRVQDVRAVASDIEVRLKLQPTDV